MSHSLAGRSMGIMKADSKRVHTKEEAYEIVRRAVKEVPLTFRPMEAQRAELLREQQEKHQGRFHAEYMLPLRRTRDGMSGDKEDFDFAHDEYEKWFPDGSVARALRKIHNFRASGKNLIVGAATSGSGKTTTAYALGRSAYILYINAQLPDRDVTRRSHDVPYWNLKAELSKTIDRAAVTPLCEATAVLERAQLEVAARLLLLVVMKDRMPDCTPRDCLDAQINGGQATIVKLVEALRGIPDPIPLVLDELGDRQVQYIVIDEAPEAQKHLERNLVSSSCQATDPDSVLRDEGRGILGALVLAASKVPKTSILALGSDPRLLNTLKFTAAQEMSSEAWALGFDILTDADVEEALRVRFGADHAASIIATIRTGRPVEWGLLKQRPRLLDRVCAAMYKPKDAFLMDFVRAVEEGVADLSPSLSAAVSTLDTVHVRALLQPQPLLPLETARASTGPSTPLLFALDAPT